MNFLELAPQTRINIFTETARSKKISVSAVEKDWWVVKTLSLVFQLSFADALVFKGGTSLSKGWGVINRFSEDIDLSIDRNFLGFKGELSRKQINKLRKKAASFIDTEFKTSLSKAFSEISDQVEIKSLNYEQSDQDPIIIEVSFPSVLEVYKYLRPSIKLEIGCRSLMEPFTEKWISPMIAEKYPDEDFIERDFKIPCINPERTMLEKIFLLHEEFQKPDGKIRVDRLSRHIYDLHQLYKAGYLTKIQGSPDLYQKVVEHRFRFNTISGLDYNLHAPLTINPIPPDYVRQAWRKDYETMLEEMIYGDDRPSFDEIIQSLVGIKSEMVHKMPDLNFRF
ncbi:MAG: nucleotidyl transferase AbiEii/AbiGii toxin family protein [Candidatus Melainabacteria bacterium]|nr:nucleotidyl transferase AbiEii/AbiGii toxin family protein [Candidatus Melainabacteria bacterium]